jgi:hypothetical protein
MKLSQLRLDSDTEINGVWVDYAEGIQFKIARLGNPAFRRYMRKLGKPLRAQMRHDVLDDETLESLSKEAIAHTVLLDWRNVEDDRGQPLEYTPAIGQKVLEDSEYADIYNFVIAVANSTENYRRTKIEDEAGKSVSE